MYATSIELFVEVLHKLFPRVYAARRKFKVPLLSSIRECRREDAASSVLGNLLDIHLDFELVDMGHRVLFASVIG